MNPLRSILTASLLLAFAACGGSDTAVVTPPTKPAATPIGPEVLAVLAKADAKDGSVDHVVHKCAGCSLGMDGENTFPLKVQDYTMHFCKQGCLDKFQPDPAKAIMTLKIKD